MTQIFPGPQRPQRSAHGRLRAWHQRIARILVPERLVQARFGAKLVAATLLLATLPLLVASIVLPMRVQTALTAAGHQFLTQTARDLAALTQGEIQQHLAAVRSLAVLDSLTGAIERRNAGALDDQELAATNRQLAALLQTQGDEFQAVFVSSADGILFAGALKSGDTQRYLNLDVSDRSYFAQVRDTLRPVVSDPIRSKVDSMPIVVVAVPVLDRHGAFAGLVGLSIEIEHLTALISGQKLGETGYPFAIDRHGIIVAHPDPQRVMNLYLAQVPGAAHLAERMLRGETGLEHYVSSKGAEKLAAFAPVPVCGWSVAASIETAEFVAPAQRLRAIIFAMIGGCIVIAAVVAFVFGMGLDRLRLALAEARESEARFKLFAGIANQTIWDWDLKTDELWWNNGLTTVLGYAAGELEESCDALLGRIPLTEREPVARAIRGCLGGGEWSGEHPFLRKDGSRAYVLHRVVAVRDANGQPVRLIGSMTDISARRGTEEKLAEQAALLDQTRDGIMVRGLDQVIQFWNRGAERIYGWTAAEAVGRRPEDLLRIDPAAFVEAGRLVLKHGEWFGRLAKTTKTGAARMLDCRWTLMRDDQGQPTSILTIDTDITEREQMEGKFLRAQRLESIGTLAGGIAHDLNNLLGPIIIGAGLLREILVDEESRKVVRCIEESAHRGTHLVRQVLSFARGVDGARVSVHIGYVAREVEAMARSTFPKNITFRVDIPKDTWLITADPTQLNQILMNLCVNARDAMPTGGQLSIIARNVQLDEQFTATNREVSPGSYVQIDVADTGTGMPAEVLEKLFEPFFTTKEPGKGTGLGLSTVIGISRSHGGTVNVYSELGKGSVFKVYLPAATSTVANAEDTVSTAPLPRGHGELILLVDDEAAILRVTKQALEKFGYQVLTAADGAQAFALFHQHRDRIALVLTDMMMPLMDGPALIAALRRIGSKVVVIAASGLNDNNNQIRATESGIQYFLCKPYTTESLLATINTALSNSPVLAARD